MTVSAAVPEEIAPFLRVVAIGVQGLWNKTPHRTLDSLPVRARIHVRYWKHLNPPTVSVLFILPRFADGFRVPNKKTFNFGPTTREWRVEVSDRVRTIAVGNDLMVAPYLGERLSQSKIEESVADLYTSPYLVERVSDEALHVAKLIITSVTPWDLVPEDGRPVWRGE